MEKFLARVGSHPILVESQHFITFLTADDTAFAIAKVTIKEEKKEKAASENGGSSSMLSWFSGTVKSAVNSVTGASSNNVCAFIYLLFFSLKFDLFIF